TAVSACLRAVTRGINLSIDEALAVEAYWFVFAATTGDVAACLDRFLTRERSRTWRPAAFEHDRCHDARTARRAGTVAADLRRSHPTGLTNPYHDAAGVTGRPHRPPHLCRGVPRPS